MIAEQPASLPTDRILLEKLNILAGQYMEIEDQLERILTIGCECLGFEFAVLAKVIDNDYHIIQRSVHPDVDLEIGAVLDLSQVCCTQVIQNNAVVTLKNISDSKCGSNPAWGPFQPQSYLGAPIVFNGYTYGSLAFYGDEASNNSFSDSQLTSLRLLAYVLGRELMCLDTEQQLHLAEEHIQKLATTDSLTGLKNRRIFLNQFRGQVELALRNPRSVSLMILDLDEFKQFNDTFGADSGDNVLKIVGQLLIESARTSDTVARFGGEEFIVLFSETDSDGAMVVAERTREALANYPWDNRLITASFGVSSVQIPDNSKRLDCDELMTKLIAAADEAMYWSKKSGRNRVSLNILYQDHLS